MATFDIETNKVTTTINDIVEVEVQSFPKIAEPIDYTWEASVQPESYAIIPTNLMGETGNLSDTVLAAIEAGYDAQLGPGGTLNLALDSLQSAIDVAQTGVNQNVGEINTLNSNVSTLETTVVARLDDNEAAVLSLEGSVAAIDYSQAYIVGSVNSAFGGDLTSHIGTIASTYVDASSAIAADLTVLETAIGNTTASVTRFDEAIVDTQVANPAWVDDGSQTDPDISGNPRYLTEARAKSSLTVDANGHIAGFVAESDGTVSNFEILADNFYMTNATTGARPFSIEGTDIVFQGKVTFGSGQTGTIDEAITSVVEPVTDNIYYPDTTTINGGNIYTGSIDAAKINTEELVVQKVWDGTGEAFAISAYGDVGPTGDKNYNVYGAKIYGGSVEGAYIHGGVVAGAFIQASTTFDQLTEFTTCPDYPAGMPVVNSFTNTDVTNASTGDDNKTLTTGSTLNFSFDSGILSYYNCAETMFKLKNGTSPVTLTSNPITFGNADYGGAETTISNLIPMGECRATKSQPDQQANPFVSKTVAQSFSAATLNVKFRGVTKNINLASYFASMTYLGDFSYNGSHKKEYGVAIPNALETGLGIYLEYTDGYGYYQYYLSSFNPPFWLYWLAHKSLRVYLYDTTTSHVSAVDTGVLATDILEWDMQVTINEDPSASGTYYGSGISPAGIFNTNIYMTVDNTN